MKKNFLFAACTLLCALFVLPGAAGCNNEKSDFKFTEIQNGGKVIGYSVLAVTADDDRIVIPQTYKSLPVISIDELAFKGYKSYSSITIPNSISAIGEYAFSGCTAEIIWDDDPTIKEIGKNAFRDYEGTSITIPDSVTHIGEYAFSGCAAELKWGDNPSIENIGESAFRGYKSTDISLPVSVTNIGEYAFFGCSRLKEIVIPEEVSYIGKGALGGNNLLTSVTFKNTEGWKISKNKDKSNPSDIDVQDPLKNAEYLRNAYNYWWRG